MASARILVADDDRGIRSLLRTCLCSCGYEVQEATNGQETMEAITRHPPPDIILLDLSMPAPDGMELLHRVHSVAAAPGPYAIVLTGNGSVPCAVKAMQLGAVDFLEKPFDLQHLLAVIRRTLGQTAIAESSSCGKPEGIMDCVRRSPNDGNPDKAKRPRLAADRNTDQDADYCRLLGLWYFATDRPAKARVAIEQAVRSANR